MNIYNKNVGMPRDFSKGKSFNFSEWNPIETYVNDSFKQDFVTYEGNLYACIKNNTNSIPGTCKCWLLVLEKLAGITFTPIIDSEGNLSWTTYVGAEVPEPVNITGPQGVQGPQGIQGEKGDQGEKGEQGDIGLQGEKGEDGKSTYDLWIETGNKGSIEDFLESLKGEDGKTGTDGEKGETGLSAYQIWLNAGNVGSELDFLEDIKGPKGDQGEKGDAGKDGASVVILGTLLSKEDLTAIYSADSKFGDGYLIGQDLWVFQGSDEPSTSLDVYHDETNNVYWINVGEIKGPKGDTGEKGEKGEKGDQGEQGPAGENAPVPVFEINSDGHLILILNEEVIDLGKVVGEGGSAECDCITPEFQIIDGVLQVSYGEEWIDLGTVKGEDGIIGKDGVPGIGITSITGPDISGIAGQTDTYTINLSDNSSYSFSITNGSDGNRIMFGNGTPENILQIVANEGDVYINLLTGDVFEYSSEWVCRGSLKFDVEEDESLFWNDYGY